jgi:hypothetical protein
LLVLCEVVFADPIPEGIRLTSEQATQLYGDLNEHGFKCNLGSVAGNHVLSIPIDRADAGRLEALLKSVKHVVPDAIFRTQGNALEIF